MATLLILGRLFMYIEEDEKTFSSLKLVELFSLTGWPLNQNYSQLHTSMQLEKWGQ